MKVNRRVWMALLIGTAVISAGGCSNPPSETETNSDNSSSLATGDGATSGDQVVNVYSSRHYDTDDVLYEEFTEQTGITVNLIEGKADQLIERIKAEGDSSPADVLITVDAGVLWRAEQAGLFQPVTSTVLEAAIPENLRHPEDMWFGLTKRARVIVYNPAEVDPSQLSTYEALAQPEWQGRVCIRSSSNVYNQSLLGSMIESNGLEATEVWAQSLVDNLARTPEGGDTDQIKAVAAGQCDVAIANHYYYARLAKSDEPADQEVAEQVDVFFPNQSDRGTHINISGAGIITTAPNAANAITFLEYLTTPAAQKVFAEGNNEYPAVNEVDVDPVVAELGEFEVDTVNVSTYGRNNPEVIQLVDRVGWQ
ncbi:MAG: Fe(3+) ABC transporter substrate-binding protein [Cyanothece sp. SIO1E1]|nr:Fe(3+) ABC transporter substrate-binding protein [Cyanothece sp. SIO1E1]